VGSLAPSAWRGIGRATFARNPRRAWQSSSRIRLVKSLPRITALTRAFAIVTQSRSYILNQHTRLHAIYPGECYAATNFLERDSFAEFTSTRTAFINHVDYFQVRRDRGVGGKAKAKSVISLNERAQTCWPSKRVLSLTSNDRFEAPRRDA
jgi:hypothetical protein